MKLLIKGISVLLVMVLMVSTFATPVVAQRGNPRVQMQGLQEDVEFSRAIELAEQFLSIRPDGKLFLSMPRHAIVSIGDTVYAQLQAGIVQSNAMVAQGYLTFDSSFHAQVTEAFNEKLTKAQPSTYIDNDIGMFAASIGGVTRIIFHWWGFSIYLAHHIVNDLVHGGALITAVLAGFSEVPFLKKLRLVAVIGGIGVATLAWWNRGSTGLRFSFSWALALVDVQPQ